MSYKFACACADSSWDHQNACNAQPIFVEDLQSLARKVRNVKTSKKNSVLVFERSRVREYRKRRTDGHDRHRSWMRICFHHFSLDHRNDGETRPI